MVHNGIEYADMQLIAEAYHLLRAVAGYSPAQIAETFRTWNTGRLDSYLIEITAEVLAHTDAATGKPFVDIVADQAEQKGTGRWTVQIALDLGVPVSGIAEAVFARSLSGHADLREASRTLPGPTAAAAARRPRPRRFADQVEQALYASKIVSYTQGFHQIQAGSDAYGWDIDLGAVGRDLAGRLHHPGGVPGPDPRARTTRSPTCRACCPTSSSPRRSARPRTTGARWSRPPPGRASPTPGFSAALAYYDALRAERLPAALTQGQRDFFGAHTYRRTDREGSFHTLWGGDRSEVRTD